MKSKIELKKWLRTLNKSYNVCGLNRDLGWGTYIEERTRLEIQIETLQKVLEIDKGTFEPVKDVVNNG